MSIDDFLFLLCKKERIAAVLLVTCFFFDSGLRSPVVLEEKINEGMDLFLSHQ
jgi:hypothetical protein